MTPRQEIAKCQLTYMILLVYCHHDTTTTLGLNPKPTEKKFMHVVEVRFEITRSDRHAIVLKSSIPSIVYKV